MSENAKIDFDDINFDGRGDALPESRFMVSDRVEFIQIQAEKPDFLVGMFIEGYGFFNVHFPRAACAEPTKKEKDWLAGRGTVISSLPGRASPKKDGL